MWLKRFTEYVLSSRFISALLAFVTSIIPIPGGSLGSLIAVLVTLRKGAFEGSLIFIAVLAANTLYLFGKSVSGQALLIATLMAVLVNVLTCLFAVILERTHRWSLVIESGALLGIAAVFVLHLFFPDIGSWWADLLTKFIKQIRNSNVLMNIPEAQLPQMALQMSHFMSGFCIVFFFASAWLQVLMGRWWQAVVYNPGGLRSELYNIRFSRFAGILLVVPLILLAIWQSFAIDCLPVIIVALTVAGLSLMHALVAKLKRGWFILVLVYVSFLLTFPLGAVIIAIFALLDVLVDFRRIQRLKG